MEETSESPNTACFVCADSCENTYTYLINLQSKKYKTNYAKLIGNLINPAYEVRIGQTDRVCERCVLLIEKYDELENETKTVKSVLSRQIAHTYSIETEEDMIYMDKSKTFVELRPNVSSNSVKYSCKICPRFVTDCIDTVNSHIMYHQVLNESTKVISEISSKQSQTQPQAKKIQRDTFRRPAVCFTPLPQNSDQKMEQLKSQQRPQRKSSAAAKVEPGLGMSSLSQEYDEETMEAIIDLNLLEDPFYDSNLKNHQCMVTGCNSKFSYVSEYVRHLKLKHKSTLNHIYGVVKANIKRPNRIGKFTCPYCYTKMLTSESLEYHVKQHEDAGKASLFTDRLSEFVSTVMSSSRCETCDCEILDPTVLECNHEIVKNGLAPKMNCIYCSRFFYSDKLYNNHLALEHSHCFVCGSTCSDSLVLQDHIKSHLTHVEHKCSFCSDIYQTKQDRFEHMKKHHPQNCCTYCTEWHTEITDLEHHIRYAHADKRFEEEKPCVCDHCGASFKSKTLFSNHLQTEHQKRKLYTCPVCKESFRYRYLLMDHVSAAHGRTIVDSESRFYKCFYCSRGFASQSRKAFVQHLSEHKANSSFCIDCNANMDSVNHLEVHRERSHQDFSMIVNKKPSTATQQREIKSENTQPIKMMSPVKRTYQSPQQTFSRTESVKVIQNEVYQHQIQVSTEDEIKVEDDQHQQIIVQNEDGTSIINMNNIILTENGELLIQNMDGFQNGQEVSEDGQIHISNLEQFLMEQGLSTGTEISYIQPEVDEGDGQVIIQNDDGTISQSSQESLMQTYKEIFEPEDDIPTELITTTVSSTNQPLQATQDMLMNGDYMIQNVQMPQHHSDNGQVIEEIEVQNNDANKSTLDELGDILLEVAAAAEKVKKPQQKQESLWGARKRTAAETIANNENKKRNTKDTHQKDNADFQARDFSQAYEFFVKGFDSKKAHNKI